MMEEAATDYVSILGVKGGPSVRPGSNMPTSILLEINGRTILVDAGLGASRSVCDQGVALKDIDAVFVTHLHSDHYLELGPLIHTAWVAGRTAPLPVHGPSRLKRYWNAFLVSMQDDIRLRIEDEGRVDIEGLAAFHVLEDSAALELDGIAVRVMANLHPPIDESFALRFEWGDRSIVLSGDTAYMPEMIEFAHEADLLVHEAMLVEGVDLLMQRQPGADERLRRHILRSHTAADDVGRIASAAKVKRLALNHFVPDGFPEFGEDNWIRATRATWQGELIIGRDGMKIAI